MAFTYIFSILEFKVVGGTENKEGEDTFEKAIFPLTFILHWC